MKNNIIVYSLKKKINTLEIIKNLNNINNIIKKYEYFINLKNLLIEMPVFMKNKKNLIKNCKSDIWINSIYTKEKKIFLYGHSKSIIIKSLLTIIFSYINNKNFKFFFNININNFFIENNCKFIKDFTINNINFLLYVENHIKKLLKFYIYKK